MSSRACFSSHFSRLLRLLLVSEEGAGDITDIAKLSSIEFGNESVPTSENKVEKEKSARNSLGSNISRRIKKFKRY